MPRISAEDPRYPAQALTPGGHRRRRGARAALPLLLLLLGVLGGVAVAPSSAPPPAPAPGDGPVVIHSWQVTHPLLSGALSGLAWGRWPHQYGADARVESVRFVQRQGYGIQAFAYVQRLNRPLFRAGQAVGALLLYGVLATLLWRGRAPSPPSPRLNG